MLLILKWKEYLRSQLEVLNQRLVIDLQHESMCCIYLLMQNDFFKPLSGEQSETIMSTFYMDVCSVIEDYHGSEEENYGFLEYETMKSGV
jgi:hypothetical protein